MVAMIKFLIKIDSKLEEITSSLYKEKQQNTEMKKKITELEQKYSDLDTKVDLQLKKEFQNEQVKNSVFIVGMPVHHGAFNNKNKGKETSLQTDSQVKQLFKQLDMDEEILTESCYRLPAPKFNDNLPGMIHVKFLRHQDKMDLIASVRNQHQIKIKPEFPQYLNEDRRNLNKKGYIMRMKEKIQTRVIHRRFEAILQTRRTQRDEWMDQVD